MVVILKHIIVSVYHCDEYRQNSAFIPGVLHWVQTYLLFQVVLKPVLDNTLPKLIGRCYKTIMSMFLRC